MFPRYQRQSLLLAIPSLVLIKAIVILAFIFTHAPLFSAPRLEARLEAQLETVIVNTTEDELNNDEDCSLREAILATNSDTAVDGCLAGSSVITDVVILSSGVYSFTLVGASEDGNLTGDLDIQGSLIISGAGADGTIIDGNQLDRVFHVHPEAAVEIAHLTVRNGLAPDGQDEDSFEVAATDGESGGGILNQGALQLAHLVIQNNTAGRGGNNPPDLSVHGSGGKGGGISNSGTLTITHSYIRANKPGRGGEGFFLSGGSFGGHGGGIYNDGRMMLIQSTVSQNQTETGDIGGRGGGIYNVGLLHIQESTIHGNRTERGWAGVSPPFATGGSGGRGGGIYNDGVINMINSTVSNNKTADGGDLYSYDPYGPPLAAAERLPSAPGVGGYGAGIYNDRNGLFRIDHSTIALNRTGAGGKGSPVPQGGPDGPFGGDGGGIYASGMVVIKNSLLMGNRTASQGNGNTCFGQIDSRGYNLFTDSEDCTIIDNEGYSRIDGAMSLPTLRDNGGPTWTHAIRFGHQAADAGTCVTIQGEIVQRDQRGISRPDHAQCDIGAVEAPAPVGVIYLPRIFSPSSLQQ